MSTLLLVVILAWAATCATATPLLARATDVVLSDAPSSFFTDEVLSYNIMRIVSLPDFSQTAPGALNLTMDAGSTSEL